MDAPIITLEMEEPRSASAGRARSSTSVVLEQYQEETARHLRRKRRIEFCSLCLVILFVLGYISYGVQKLWYSWKHPLTNTWVIAALSYEVPFFEVCYPNYTESSQSVAKGEIVPLWVTISDQQWHADVVCGYWGNDENGEKVTNCQGLYTSDTTSILENRDEWKILNFTDEADYSCLAFIPPTNASFAYVFTAEFIFVPDDDSAFDSSEESFMKAQQVEDEYGILLGVLHPDELPKWAEAVANGWTQPIFPWFSASLWSSLRIKLSMFSTTTLSESSWFSFTSSSKETSSVYSTKYLGKIYGRDNQYSISNLTNWVYPSFGIEFDADVRSFEEDGTPKLFKSFSEESMAFGIPDLISGVGGVMSIALKFGAILVGLILAGEYLPACIAKYWHGVAPYPPFPAKFEERLRRVIDKEVERFLRDHYNMESEHLE